MSSGSAVCTIPRKYPTRVFKSNSTTTKDPLEKEVVVTVGRREEMRLWVSESIRRPRRALVAGGWERDGM